MVDNLESGDTAGHKLGMAGDGGNRTMGLIVRILQPAGSALAGLFVAEDAPNFGVIQGIMGIAALAIFVAVIAFWPRRWK
jgi:hypothetical protein